MEVICLDGASQPRFQNAAKISLPVHNRDNLKRSCLWPVDNRVVSIPGQRPKAKGAGCHAWPDVAAQRCLGDKRARSVDRLFNAVSGSLVVNGDGGPNAEDICFG
jgi:hypothetical protein